MSSDMAAVDVSVPPASPRWRPLERTAALLMLVFVSSLAIEWIGFGAVAGGDLKIFHIAGLGLAAVSLLRPESVRAMTAVARSRGALFTPLVLYLAVVGAASMLHVGPYFPRTELLRQVLYSSLALVVAGFCVHAVHQRSRHTMRWLGLATTLSVVVGLSLAVAGKGANPASIVSQAISSADPDVLSGFFRVAFRSQAFEDANLNLRHKVAAAVWIATLAAAAFIPPSSSSRGRMRGIGMLTIVVGSVLTLLTLSRSIILTMFIAALLIAVRILVRGRASSGQAATAGLLLAVVAVGVFSPVGVLVSARFVDQTDSYEARSSAAAGFFDELGETAIIGAPAESVERNPHNIILNAWLSGGVAAFAFTLMWFSAYVIIWLREVHRLLLAPSRWRLPVNHLPVVALGLVPIVRAFTAGKGWHMTEWLAVGLMLGLTEANRRALEEADRR